jgi:hypothetical protein
VHRRALGQEFAQNLDVGLRRGKMLM